jgi:hypothetical protein
VGGTYSSKLPSLRMKAVRAEWSSEILLVGERKVES